MAAIYNLEFTRIDNEVSIYINGRLRATNFVHEDPKINVKFQFYVEKSQPAELTVVFYYGQRKPKTSKKPWNQARMAFTLHKSGSRRPIAIVHDYWDDNPDSKEVVKDYSYTLFGDA